MEIEPKVGDVVREQLIESEMQKSYLDYAMSVIVGRALPDVRDGLKPVHRRILYAMHELGLTRNKAHKKSARIVGEVLGKYHPHGDTAVYDSMVRMAQEFALRYPLVDGQGNFGSIDGDSAAAMRYTEARMTKIAEEILLDIEKETVDFRLNFDESLKEPEVLPSKLPNLLINGSYGIAVGMATNVPPHNIGEVGAAVIKMIDEPEIALSELIGIVPGPDFPTGGTIQGRSGILQAYTHGRGRVRLRGKTHIEEKKRKAIIIDEVPYQVNKAMLVEEIAHNVRDKIIQGISDIRDESDREGMRVVIELKTDASTEIVLNQLYKHTRLQVTYSIINLALVDNIPKVLNLKQILEHFIAHRTSIVTRRTQFELTKAEKKAHILLGLKKAIENLDKAIAIIRGASSPAIAKEQLSTAFMLDEVQSQAILDMKLQRLTGLERDKIVAEYEELLKLIADLRDILQNKSRVMDIIKEETQEMIDKYQDSRRTQIVDAEDDVEIEDLIEDTHIVVTISRGGYCKRLPVDTYKAQNRGGKGIIGATTKEDDIVESLFITHNKATLLCFTNKGKVHWIKAYQIPEASRTAQGKHFANLIQMENGEELTTVVPISEFKKDKYLFFATKNGVVKKTPLSDYSRPRAGGIKGIILDEDDQLVRALLTDGEKVMMLATAHGAAVRFSERDVRPMGRVTRGVRGITLSPGDSVVSLLVAEVQKTVLTITEQGYGKRTKTNEYRLIGRGGKGVINIQTTERNGKVVGVRSVEDEDSILVISKKGIVMRTRADQVSVIGRNTQGVRIMRMIPGDVVAGISKIVQEPDEAELEDKQPSNEGQQSTQ